jgi:hypothetical protein
MSALDRQLARMMWWQDLSAYPGVALLLAATAATAAELIRDWSGLAEPDRGLIILWRLGAIIIGFVCALALVVCWLITLWHIYWAGKLAFGVRSAVIYTGLALILLPWPGLYVIPHMIRLDAGRPPSAEPDEPEDDPDTDPAR